MFGSFNVCGSRCPGGWINLPRAWGTLNHPKILFSKIQEKFKKRPHLPCDRFSYIAMLQGNCLIKNQSSDSFNKVRKKIKVLKRFNVPRSPLYNNTCYIIKSIIISYTQSWGIKTTLDPTSTSSLSLCSFICGINHSPFNSPHTTKVTPNQHGVLE